jgi:hypothetical protein
MRKTWVLAAAGLLAACVAYAAEPVYIGADKCRMCHKVEHQSWSEQAHARALEALKPEDRARAECLSCHATGGRADLPGVQCEACHGPGSEYKSLKIMQDHAASLAAGLVVPGAGLCRSCHEKAPHEVRFFDYGKMQVGGAHAVKKKD